MKSRFDRKTWTWKPASQVKEEGMDSRPGLNDPPVSVRGADAPLQHTPIPGWAGYFASEDGKIWSATDWRGYGVRELRQDLDRHFYPTVRLTVGNGTRRRQKVHKLVALTFLGPRPSPAHEVRHLDGDRSNNRVGNLAWGTRAENAADREIHGHTSRGERHSAAIKRGLEARHV